MTSSLFENNGADFSPCGKYRYKLWRIWNEELPIAMCIGLNPSTANSAKNDPTINILKRMLTKLGYGGFYMMNLYSYISTKPSELIDVDEVEKRNNFLRLIETAKTCDTVIFAWGNFKKAINSGRFVSGLFDGVCFDKSSSGAPIHPLAMQERNGRDPNNPQLIKF